MSLGKDGNDYSIVDKCNLANFGGSLGANESGFLLFLHVFPSTMMFCVKTEKISIRLLRINLIELIFTQLLIVKGIYGAK